VVGDHDHREIDLVRVAQAIGFRGTQVIGFRGTPVVGFRVIATPNGVYRPSSRRLPAGSGPESLGIPVA
jgi:hypothetical protein